VFIVLTLYFRTDKIIILPDESFHSTRPKNMEAPSDNPVDISWDA
jgi:hypothetical protein